MLFFDKAAGRARKIWCLGSRLAAKEQFLCGHVVIAVLHVRWHIGAERLQAIPVRQPSKHEYTLSVDNIHVTIARL